MQFVSLASARRAHVLKKPFPHFFLVPSGARSMSSGGRAPCENRLSSVDTEGSALPKLQAPNSMCCRTNPTCVRSCLKSGTASLFLRYLTGASRSVVLRTHGVAPCSQRLMRALRFWVAMGRRSAFGQEPHPSLWQPLSDGFRASAWRHRWRLPKIRDGRAQFAKKVGRTHENLLVF